MPMKSLTVRFALLAAILLFCNLGVAWVQSGYSFTVRQPARELEQLPLELGGLTGRDQELPTDILEFVNARGQISRIYESSDGRSVSVYSAVWADESIAADVSPHHPEICYPNAGWQIIDRQESRVKTSSGILPLGLMQLEREGQRVVVAHWFQLGPHRYTGRNEGREVFGRLWGEKEWPPLVKVMLQTPARSIDEAAPLLQQTAAAIHQFTRDIR